MIPLQRLRELRLKEAEGGRKFIAAASGLVIRGELAIVVGDDSLSLGAFSIRTTEPGVYRRLFPGVLPEDPIERKRMKPDFECLFELSRDGGEKLLVVVPSGSKENRFRGVCIDGDETRPLNFTGLFAELRKSVVGLNIEGAVETGDVVALFHRGNTAGSENAVVRLDRAEFAREVGRGVFTGRSLRGIAPIALGNIDGVPLTFGDAACDSKGRVWFLASAEATDDAYQDGVYGGAVLGRLDAGLTRVEESHRIASLTKPEGLAFDPEDGWAFYLVTDADDPGAISELYRGLLE